MDKPIVNYSHDDSDKWRSLGISGHISSQDVLAQINDALPFLDGSKIIASVAKHKQLTITATEVDVGGKKEFLEVYLKKDLDLIICLNEEKKICFPLNGNKKGTDIQIEHLTTYLEKTEKSLNNDKAYRVYEENGHLSVKCIGDYHGNTITYVFESQHIGYLDSLLRCDGFIELFSIQDPQRISEFVKEQLETIPTLSSPYGTSQPSLHIQPNKVFFKQPNGDMVPFINIQKTVETESIQETKPIEEEHKDDPKPNNKVEKRSETIQIRDTVDQNDIEELKGNKQRFVLTGDKYILQVDRLKEAPPAIIKSSFNTIAKDTGEIPGDVHPLFYDGMTLSELINNLRTVFPSRQPGHHLDELGTKLIDRHMDIHLERQSPDSEDWNIDIKTTTKQDLDKREREIIERENKLKSEKAILETTQSLVREIKQRLEIPDQDDRSVITAIEKKTSNIREANVRLEKLTKSINPIDIDIENANKKIQHLVGFFGGERKLADLSVDDFKRELLRFRDSYKMLDKLNRLKDFDQNSLLYEFYGVFGDISADVKSRVDKLEQNIREIDENFVIFDVIKARLADPEIRKKSVPKQDLVNAELKRYKLKLNYPQPGEPVDPARQKIVGYDNAGPRGSISSVVSWGLSEIDELGNEVAVIYKPEVIISK